MAEKLNGAESNIQTPEPSASPVGHQVQARIEIVWLDNGHINVAGPMENEMVFDHMMKHAARAAEAWRAQQQAPKLVRPLQ